MAALLKDAIQPNLAQTLENNPAFVHGGPFANIALGCNSVIATKAALKMADFVVTEAGFGADLGAEKFLDIKCRKAGLRPDAVVLVATVRALKMHGGVGKDDLTKENVKAVEQGLENLGKHLENLAKYGVRAVVAINQFTADTEAEMAVIRDYCQGFGVDAYVCSHWADGGAGAEDLAKKVAEIAQSGVSDFHTLYEDEMPLWDKMRTVAQEIYGAEDISGDRLVTERFKQLQDQGYGHLPICVAKTQYSFSTDPNRKGAPKGHVVSIREVRLAAGAEFLVVVCGDIMTMPGLPSRPAAEQIGLDENGQITGLF
ncbi:MAG: formate--tetrahydrofolate ligase, partial [Rhodospirillaceae bacterium]|nr:formate--tetrahydrofolate ligase [Rhodospirillaceae bacterium]